MSFGKVSGIMSAKKIDHMFDQKTLFTFIPCHCEHLMEIIKIKFVSINPKNIEIKKIKCKKFKNM